LDLKLLLKRGALLTAANWPVVVIQFVAHTMFQFLLAVPIVAAAVLAAALFGADLANLLQGGTREMLTRIADALRAEPAALSAFLAALGLVIVGGSIFMFLVKGGTVGVLLAADDMTGAFERDPITLDALKQASRFTPEAFMRGCTRLFPRYLALGLVLMLIYALSAGAYLAFLLLGYQTANDGAFVLLWTFLAALASGAMVVWITAVNLVYLLMQIAVAADDLGLAGAARAVARFIRSDLRNLGGIFLIVLAMVVGATLASAVAWSGVALVAFVPLIGLAVIPLQAAALVVRGVLFHYIGLTALGAYVTLYRQHALRAAKQTAGEGLPDDAGALKAWG
jgi:hypothetical protein